MATYTIDKIGYNSNTYIFQDSGALQLTGGNVTGPVSFGDSVTIDEATIGDLVVNGAASFTNNLQANTINGVTVGSSPKFTDTVYSHPSATAYSSGLYKITVNNLGHVTAATAVAKADITNLGIPGSDTNYYHTTGSWNGLTYTATKVGSPGDLAFTIPTGTTSTTVARGDHTHNYAAASHDHSQIVTVGDQRSTATTPNSYANKIIFQGLKNNSTIGSPSTDTYSYVVGLRGWSDSSGGNSHEIAFNNSGIYIRQGATTSWGSWSKISTFSGNYNDLTNKPTIPTDTWRKVQLNGTDKLGTATSTNPLNLKAGDNMSITESSGTFTFTATNTDTKVTSSANHYTPSTASGNDKTASASGATAAWSIDVVKGITINTDGKGHITGVSVTSGKIPAQPSAYSLPVATYNALGGVKPWKSYTASSTGPTAATASTAVAVNAITTTSGKYYAVEMDKDGRMFVNVPWSAGTAYTLPLAANGTRGGVQIGYSESGTNYAVKLSSEKMYVSVPWTDTKVTAVGNHYTPSGGSTTSASGASGTAGTTVQVVTGIKLDAAGHVTGISSGAATDTTYTLSGLGGVGTISASGTAPLTLSASKSGTTVTISGSISVGTGSNQVAAGNHTHSGYASSTHTHSEYVPMSSTSVDVKSDAFRIRNNQSSATAAAGTNPYVTSLLLGDGREATFDEYGDGYLAIHGKSGIFLHPQSTAIPVYDATATYSVGTVVWYNRAYYRCTTAITTAEAWTSGHWTNISASAGNVKVHGNVLPTVTETYDLGSSSLKWNNIYAKTISGSIAWSNITSKPTSTGSSATGITIAAHGTGTVTGVQSTTTTASKASGGNGSASTWTFESKTVANSINGAVDNSDNTMLVITLGTTVVQSKSGGGNGSAPTWSFTDVTVPIKNSSASTFVTGTTHTVTDPKHSHTIS